MVHLTNLDGINFPYANKIAISGFRSLNSSKESSFSLEGVKTGNS